MPPHKQLYPVSHLTAAQREIKTLCENDLKAFVALVAPQRMLGHCHLDLLDFFSDSHQEGSHKLALWPRSHQKSFLIALWCAHRLITKPEATILYASATASLAYLQLGSIKQTLMSPIVSLYWQGLCNPEEGKRELWRQDQIAVDHWKRREEAVRDPSLMAVGMGANITGTHFDVVVLDDIVVYDNCNTPELRRSTATWYSLLSSILNPGGIIQAVGTRYHPQDLYQSLIDMKEEVFDDEGNVIEERQVYKVSQKVVEENGEFLWPKQRRKDGKWFGFDKTVLAKTRSSYLDRAQFFAQYYNDPSDPTKQIVQEFEYYERDLLTQRENRWYLGSRLLNVFAAIDFASTVSKKSDYTCICVIGMDTENNIYVLDINRFKTDKISVMQEELTKMYSKWRWIKLRGEATAAQNLVVNQIKEMNRKLNLFYTIEIFKPTTDKLVRMKTNLEPRYAAKALFHYRGGNCQLLEDELMSDRPPHDDIKDSLASAVEIASPPVGHRAIRREDNVIYNTKFGGIA